MFHFLCYILINYNLKYYISIEDWDSGRGAYNTEAVNMGSNQRYSWWLRQLDLVEIYFVCSS